MIKFYSTNCPLCMQIKALMDSKSIQYEYVTDIETIFNIADANGILGAPFAEVDGKLMNSKQLEDYIRTLQ